MERTGVEHQVQGPLGWGWQGPRRTERCALQTPRPGLILANPAPVGILVVDTPSPWHVPPRLCGEPIAGADRKGAH